MEAKSFEKYITRIKYGKCSWEMRTEESIMNIVVRSVMTLVLMVPLEW